MELFQDIFVGTLVVSMMLSVGFDLTADQILGVLKRPWIVLLGVVLNYVVIPLVALGTNAAFGLATPVRSVRCSPRRRAPTSRSPSRSSSA